MPLVGFVTNRSAEASVRQPPADSAPRRALNRHTDCPAKVLQFGAKPVDLPAEATRFEMVVNLKTAKTIGAESPTGALLRADAVIE